MRLNDLKNTLVIVIGSWSAMPMFYHILTTVLWCGIFVEKVTLIKEKKIHVRAIPFISDDYTSKYPELLLMQMNLHSISRGSE